MRFVREQGDDADSGSHTERYGYDPLGQLTSVTRLSVDGMQVLSTTRYDYDEAGNRFRVVRTGSDAGTDLYVANELNQYTAAGDATFEHDTDGNLIRQEKDGVETNYTYDHENRLVGVATPTDTWIYSYDAFGTRTSTTHNGQTTR